MLDFVNFTLLAVFIPTFFVVSITPGMCMTLSLSMGMSIGLKKTFYMMYGELIGVGLVATASVIGVATIMLKYPSIFLVLKYGGGAYLFYLGIQMWLSRGKMALSLDECNYNVSKKSLAIQGFITAIANPKGWAFFIALLPPFIDDKLPMTSQLIVLIFMILVLEFSCLIIYATGGKTLRKLLQNSSNVRLINKVAGILMMGIGIWLASS
ncbi:LysE family translocator [Poseidonibacter ostreae]|uniref:LysE family translocator n=1 Tax=Poseidonibacter ostreae TaxID=2654171 RepID=A0A6L4WW83_9BACT|nr:LysE family translocator [Poseidonibacter ostreae]KAB7891079.1 LysE family translocator [Poseidonibacter ostreae]KAB7892803.1 LysE family translocator [Poseidonibacter ostreae]